MDEIVGTFDVGPTEPAETTSDGVVLQRIARAARFGDEETVEHVERVSRSSSLIARELGWRRDACVKLGTASALHDLGKVGVPEAVLRKRGTLSPSERALMERHTEIGFEILSGSGHEVLDLAATVALTHHERVDGSGYPVQMAGEDIPREGRIVAVADAFDSLTHDRHYRPSFDRDEAVELMQARRGTHFDEPVLNAFLRVLPEVEALAARYPDFWSGPPPDSGAEQAAATEPVRVLVVEQRPALARGLTLLLRREGFEIVGIANTLDHARELTARRSAQVAIVDGDIARESIGALAPARVLVYVDPCANVSTDRVAAHADGLVSKTSDAPTLIAAVRKVASGERFVDDDLAKHEAAERSLPQLTPREREVVALLADGLTGEEIARHLFLSPETIRTHVRNAMARVGAKTRTHLVMIAAEQGGIRSAHRRGRSAAQ